MNMLEQDYEEYIQLKKNLNSANDEELIKEAKIALTLFWFNTGRMMKHYNIVLSKYMNTKENGNEYIDFDNETYLNEVEGLVNCMKRCDIKYFTYSSNWHKAIDVSWCFKQNGCELVDIIQINSYKNYRTGEFEKRPAFLFKIL